MERVCYPINTGEFLLKQDDGNAKLTHPLHAVPKSRPRGNLATNYDPYTPLITQPTVQTGSYYLHVHDRNSRPQFFILFTLSKITWKLHICTELHD